MNPCSGSGAQARVQSQVDWHPLHAQLPALERLNLFLTSASEIPTPGLATTLGRLSVLATLTALSLETGRMHGLLRHLRLPKSVKAGCPSSCWSHTVIAVAACKSLSETLGGVMSFKRAQAHNQVAPMKFST